MSLAKLRDELELYDINEDKALTLEDRNIARVKHVLSDFDTRKLFGNLLSDDYVNSVKYSDVVELKDKLYLLHNVVSQAKEDIDIDEFFKRGEILDFDKLETIFKKQNLIKRYPNFDIKKYQNLLRNPPEFVMNYKGEQIPFDKVIARKILVAINQMVFNEMDLYVANCGSEGSGKSCWCSQLLLFLHTVLTEVGLVEYAYDVRKLFFSSLKSMIDLMDEQVDDDYFRLFGLDEAYELNRSNFRDEKSKTFKDDMRSSRKMQRIIMLNLPQLGELELAIVQTRLNFIFDVKMDNDVKTGTLKKGRVDFYIMPRGKKIYSYFHRRDISKAEIVNTISAIMKDKNDSYKGLPKNCLIHTFNFEGIWGFDKAIYDKHIKKENRKRRNEGDFKLSKYVLYLFFRYAPPLKNWGLDKKDIAEKRAYYTLQKILRSMKIPFLENKELRENMEHRLSSD